MPRPVRVRCLIAALVTVALLPAQTAVAGPWIGPVPDAPHNFGLPADYRPTEAQYGVGYQLGKVIPLSDGTELNALVRYPTDASGRPAPGPFPVIVSFTTYSAMNGALTAALTGTLDDLHITLPNAWEDTRTVINVATAATDYLVRRGYIEVVADSRGTGQSTGQWSPAAPQDGEDGVEVVDWAAKLPGSNGKVGMYGYSFPAFNAVRTAGAVGPGSPLKAIVPIGIGNSLMSEALNHDGILSPILFSVVAFMMPYQSIVLPLLYGIITPQLFIRSMIDHFLAIIGKDSSILALLNAYTGGDKAYHESFWADRDLYPALHNYVDNNIPAYFIDGFWDIYQDGAFDNYTQLQNLSAGRPQLGPMAPGQKPDGRFQLLEGPWYHLTLGDGPGSRLDIKQLMTAWFDRWLKDIDNGIDKTDTPLHVIDTGNFALDTATVPFQGAEATKLFIRHGALADHPGNDSAAPDALAYTGIDNFCNRENFEQWTAGVIETGLSVFGLHDPCAENVIEPTAGLEYTAAPVTEDTVLAGPANLALYVSSTSKDAAIQVYLDDVAPDGSSVAITGGTQLASQRALNEERTWRTADGTIIAPEHVVTREAAQPLTPGEIVKLDIKIRTAFHRLAAGHALRMRITSGNFPTTIPNPVDLPNLLGSTQQIHQNASHSSQLIVPLAPVDQLNR
ncbi:CocE/NonD family hydrolase [Nocardia colli]|uniref:CocE/NonD family hydrolase n=1 Tax=Nocardia colli TaxID=2545717 RepID=UPI0035E0FF5F